MQLITMNWYDAYHEINRQFHEIKEQCCYWKAVFEFVRNLPVELICKCLFIKIMQETASIPSNHMKDNPLLIIDYFWNYIDVDEDVLSWTMYGLWRSRDCYMDNVFGRFNNKNTLNISIFEHIYPIQSDYNTKTIVQKSEINRIYNIIDRYNIQLTSQSVNKICASDNFFVINIAFEYMLINDKYVFDDDTLFTLLTNPFIGTHDIELFLVKYKIYPNDKCIDYVLSGKCKQRFLNVFIKHGYVQFDLALFKQYLRNTTYALFDLEKYNIVLDQEAYDLLHSRREINKYSIHVDEFLSSIGVDYLQAQARIAHWDLNEYQWYFENGAIVPDKYIFNNAIACKNTQLVNYMIKKYGYELKNVDDYEINNTI